MVLIAKTKVSKGNLTVVPKPVREALNIKEGDILEWHVENGKIVVKKST